MSSNVEAAEANPPPPAPNRCVFVGESGEPCPDAASPGVGYCYWHDPTSDKRGADVKAKLEAVVASGRSLEGFNLRGADLEDAHLTHGHRGTSANFRNADLSRAILRNAHMFNCDLRGASLLKADLREANMNHAQLESVNLLGADLRDARIERIHWGRYLMQEYAASRMRREGRTSEAEQLYGEAEEVYRAISLAQDERGHSNQAGHFFVKQMVMRRMQMPRWSRERFWSWVVDLVCGYGESTMRVVAFAMLIIFGCALAYFLGGIHSADGSLIAYSADQGLSQNVSAYLTCVYFSVVTFTTVGYGEIFPVGAVRAVAAVETLMGWFSISLFVVLFVKRMTR